MATAREVDKATSELQELERLYRQKKIRREEYDKKRGLIIRWLASNVVKGKI